jgi:hypothetical protein
VRRERPLGGDGPGDRVAGALERVEEGVALRVELAAASGTKASRTIRLCSASAAA